tara:strand:+ start:193 stop:612 length:420 start_codon:yes stop_codon:yes gene_type:complete
MIDFSGSKENARMLIERFIETGEQPDFMEYLCFKSCYVNAEFYGYGAEYILDHFIIYAGISKFKRMETHGDIRLAQMLEVEHCYSACRGLDVINEAKKRNVGFHVVEGKLHLIKKTQAVSEDEYQQFEYYSSKGSKLAN